MAYFMVYVWLLSILAIIGGVVSLVIIKIGKRDTRLTVKTIIISFIVFLGSTLSIGFLPTPGDIKQNDPEGSKVEQNIQEPADEPKDIPEMESPDDGKESNMNEEQSSPLIDYGFTQEESDKIDKVLSNVGITQYTVSKVANNGSIDTIIGRTSDDNYLQVNIILENKEVISIFLSDMGTEKHNVKVKKNGKVKVTVESDKMSVDLYYDHDGGYLAVYHGNDGTITDYETGEVIVEKAS